jgi:hypothetical protein
MAIDVDLTGGLGVDQEFVLPQRPRTAGMRDAVNIWLATDDYRMGMRVGVEAVAEQWDAHDIWLDIAFADGRVLSLRESGDVHNPLDDSGRPTIRGAGPVRFQCITPFELWTVSYVGMAAETTAQDLVRGDVAATPTMTEVEFHIELSMAVPPWVPGSLLPEARKALQGKQGEFMSPRYEQLFHAEGWYRAGVHHEDFKANGLRIRRQGVRQFQGFQGHCWQSAVFPSGKAFGFNIYPPAADGEPAYNEGFVFDGQQVIPARAVEVPWLRKLQTAGDDVSFVLETVNGQRIAIQGETFINTRSRGHAVLPADFPIVQQAHARYRWDGEETSGMIERSSLPDLVTIPG